MSYLFFQLSILDQWNHRRSHVQHICFWAKVDRHLNQIMVIIVYLWDLCNMNDIWLRARHNILKLIIHASDFSVKIFYRPAYATTEKFDTLSHVILWIRITQKAPSCTLYVLRWNVFSYPVISLYSRKVSVKTSSATSLHHTLQYRDHVILTAFLTIDLPLRRRGRRQCLSDWSIKSEAFAFSSHTGCVIVFLLGVHFFIDSARRMRYSSVVFVTSYVCQIIAFRLRLSVTRRVSTQTRTFRSRSRTRTSIAIRVTLVSGKKILRYTLGHDVSFSQYLITIVRYRWR